MSLCKIDQYAGRMGEGEGEGVGGGHVEGGFPERIENIQIQTNGISCFWSICDLFASSTLLI